MADAPQAATQQQQMPEDMDALLDQLTTATGIQDVEAKRVARKGVEALIAQIVNQPAERIDKALVDHYIAELDADRKSVV